MVVESCGQSDLAQLWTPVSLSGGTDELLTLTLRLFYKWIIVPKTLHSNDFDVHMLLRRSWILQRMCLSCSVTLTVSLSEGFYENELACMPFWQRTGTCSAKKGLKSRESDESVSVPLQVCEVIKCVTYPACQVLHSIWCPCPLRRGVWEGNWWGILWGKWDRRGLQNIDKKHIHHSDICMYFHVESYYFHAAQRNKSVCVWLIATMRVCMCVCVRH